MTPLLDSVAYQPSNIMSLQAQMKEFSNFCLSRFSSAGQQPEQRDPDLPLSLWPPPLAPPEERCGVPRPAE